VAFFDNVKGRLGGEAIEGAITSGELRQRVLGASVDAVVPWRATVLCTGNNMTMTEDMLRRSLVCRIEPPESRGKFIHPDLVDWTRAHRARLIASALTILRAYAVKGCPETGAGHLDSFLEWSRLVPAAIVYAGGPNVIAAVGTVEMSGSDEAGAFAVFLRELDRMSVVDQWRQPTERRSLTTKELLDRLYPAPRSDEPPDGWDDMREAVSTMSPTKGNFPPDLARLGRAIQERSGQYSHGLKLVRTTSKGQRRWGTERASK
jgi:hypothetical protein